MEQVRSVQTCWYERSKCEKVPKEMENDSVALGELDLHIFLCFPLGQLCLRDRDEILQPTVGCTSGLLGDNFICLYLHEGNVSEA